MGGISAGIVLLVVLVAVVGYIVVRVRQGTPPAPANEGGHDAAWDTDGAVPRDPDGMPMARPDGPDGVEGLDRSARDQTDRPTQP